MSDLILVEPDIKYQKSFEKYAISYKNVDDEHYFNKYKNALTCFQDYLAELLQGEVKTSTFWLIDQEEVTGVVRIRHQDVEGAGHIGYDIAPDYRNRGYGFQILKLALVKAAMIGLKEVILTCNFDNIASRKIIEKNNFNLLGTVYDQEENEYLYKYSKTI